MRQKPTRTRPIRNSGGVTVFVKHELVHNGTIRRIFKQFSECVVLLIDGSKYIGLNDIILIFAYVSPEYPPVYEGHNPNGIELLSDKLLDITNSFPDAEIFVPGALNARVKDFLDFIPEGTLDYIFGNDTVYPTDSFNLPRYSKDCDHYNKFGLSLIEICCTYGIHILNSRLFNDKRGEFTCFANNGKSVVDYMIASTNIFDLFTDFGVSDNAFSDHCPVYYTLTLNLKSSQTTSPNEDNLKAWNKIRSKESLKDDFLVKFTELLKKFREEYEVEDNSASDMLTNFIQLFQDAAVKMQYKDKPNVELKKQPDRWNPNCDLAKKENTKH